MVFFFFCCFGVYTPNQPKVIWRKMNDGIDIGRTWGSVMRLDTFQVTQFIFATTKTGGSTSFIPMPVNLCLCNYGLTPNMWIRERSNLTSWCFVHGLKWWSSTMAS